MSTQEQKLQKFIKALDVVKDDFTCRFCSKLCTDPVTLSTCLHTICSSHFEGLSHCPTCNIPLTNCTLYWDDRMQSTISATQELLNMFEGFRKKNDAGGETSSGSSKRYGKHNSETLKSTTVSENKNKLEKSNVKTPKSKNEHLNSSSVSDKKRNALQESNAERSNATSKKLAKQNSETKTVSDIKNKPGKPKVTTPKNKNENLNSTVISTNSKIFKGNEKKNSKGETALQIACRLGNVDRVKQLLKEGANINTKDNAGWTPLHEVVQNGQVELVKLLLQHNTLINVPGQCNETPLHEAIRYNHQEIAIELVKNGANVNARNCKGETPMQLASKEMKRLLKETEENIIQNESSNIIFISDLCSELDYEDIRAYCVSTTATVISKLKLLSKHHPNLHIEQKLTKQVTHLIVDTDDNDVCTSTLDILQGIVNGIWIISTNWITKSSDKRLEPFKEHEVIGVGAKIYNGPRNARYNKYKQLPGIFNGCHFYLHNFNLRCEVSEKIVLTKTSLSKLITDAGGIVLRRVPNPESIPEQEQLVPFHAKEGSKLFKCSHYIIFHNSYEPMYNMSHIKALPIGWLIECIERYELCEPW